MMGEVSLVKGIQACPHPVIGTSLSLIHASRQEGPHAGIIPRIVEDVFAYMEAAPTSSAFTLRVAYVEIYLERICDLLNPEVRDDSCLAALAD